MKIIAARLACAPHGEPQRYALLAARRADARPWLNSAVGSTVVRQHRGSAASWFGSIVVL